MELHAQGPGTSTADLAELGALAQQPTVAAIVAAAHEVLDLDVAYIATIADERLTVGTIHGDGSPFQLKEGLVLPLEETFDGRVLAGRLPSVIPDVAADDRARGVTMTRKGAFGAYVAVPVTTTSGSVLGTISAAGRSARPDLGYRHLQLLHVLARMAADRLELSRLAVRITDAERQAAVAVALVIAAEARDGHTPRATADVVKHAVAVARRLDLDADEVADVRRLALLHDVGKLSVADGILGRPGPLAQEELDVVRSHSEAGERAVKGVAALAHLAPAVRAGHEHWDGSGYPDGLAGTAIPVAARIVLVCDAYQAMIADRPQRPGMSHDEALAAIEAGLGGQFCPSAGRAFLNVINNRT
jgi:response regulator RpfG family c-di-GMP phosphodiesterase